jgi:hypothetical protein
MPAIPIQLSCISMGGRSDQQRLARGPKAATHVPANTKIVPLPGLEPWLSNPKPHTAAGYPQVLSPQNKIHCTVVI